MTLETSDVVGAYLLVNMENYALVKLTGKTIDIMCGIRKNYETCVAIKNGKRVLFLRLTKVFYGYMP